jgi:membrane protease YdiL (CAAX protease family)
MRDVEPIEQETPRPGWLPIVTSAGLFSLLHFSHGPDWIPLFFLALGLGYLYRQTHRITPCVVVHLLVNSLAVLQLWLYVQERNA